MRLFLEGAEVWRGVTFLGIVSVDWLAAQIAERLDDLAIGEWLRAELAAPVNRRLGPPADDTRPLPRRPLAFMPITRDLKAKRRDQRRKNKGKRGAP